MGTWNTLTEELQDQFNDIATVQRIPLDKCIINKNDGVHYMTADKSREAGGGTLRHTLYASSADGKTIDRCFTMITYLREGEYHKILEWSPLSVGIPRHTVENIVEMFFQQNNIEPLEVA
ncbi:hypothetical protein HW450_06535 [Corynebacterium hindlerae]|uniref:Uncharacterized protein n=1 Tax=Corynebacterium hindlerae TaxID=699041 RepID=A0A7G5FIA7_9CORY|nr:hypothetical protein [Corynebacterium hindlerae]QMV86348.1 hypothetical protein HW450_06535 [Corynebacterium hindlerae]